MDDDKSQDGSFDEDIDEPMQDDEGDGDDNDLDNDDGQDEGDDDADNDNEDDEGDNADNDGDTQSQPDGAQHEGDASGQAAQTSDSRRGLESDHPRPEVLSASTYDIVPTIAAPQSTSINAVCGTQDSRWIFTGGADGYIRQYNWVDSVNGKTQLTVAQRHPFVDSVVKAGVLMTYWENFDARKMTPESTSLTTAQSLSPVYSLACQSQGLWLLSGTASGAIRLQTVRHDEGKEVTLLQKHTSAVSVLSLSSDEKSLLSGGWDKAVVDWDLNTGQVRTNYAISGGQVSCIESRPISSVPVPYESGETVKPSTTFSSNNAAPLTNGTNIPSTPPTQNKGAATPDSLFGGDDGDDDLFGDSAAGAMTNGNAFGFDESEINTTTEDGTIADTVPPPEDAQPPQSPTQNDTQPPQPSTPPTDSTPLRSTPPPSSQPVTNGLPHSTDDPIPPSDTMDIDLPSTTPPQTSDSTFLATSIDGAIRIWDRRIPNPIARITPHDTPPWCLSACWSPSGNTIYAGRRNNTVEEYDLRTSLKRPERVFRFPQGSGPVTCVKAMPNGRHLVCASYDILRLYDLQSSAATAPISAPGTGVGKSGTAAVPFLIVPGHRTGTISNLYLSADCRYMLSSGGNRGWQGTPTEVLLGYEIGVPGMSGGAAVADGVMGV